MRPHPNTKIPAWRCSDDCMMCDGSGVFTALRSVQWERHRLFNFPCPNSIRKNLDDCVSQPVKSKEDIHLQLIPTCTVCYDTGITHQDSQNCSCEDCSSNKPHSQVLVEFYQQNPLDHPSSIKTTEEKLIKQHYPEKPNRKRKI